MRVCDRQHQRLPCCRAWALSKPGWPAAVKCGLCVAEGIYILDIEAQLSLRRKWFVTCCVPLPLSQVFQSVCRELNPGTSVAWRTARLLSPQFTLHSRGPRSGETLWRSWHRLPSCHRVCPSPSLPVCLRESEAQASALPLEEQRAQRSCER